MMKTSSNTSPKLYIGLDVHQEPTSVALTDLHVCYEAGGCVMWTARQLAKIKVRCTVIAPSLIPLKAGDPVKTDKKDAIELASQCVGLR